MRGAIPSRRRVLILDAGNGGGSLSVARSLAPAGYQVHLGFSVGTPRRAASSRYCSGTIAYPDPTHSRDEFQHRMLEVAPSYDFVFPVKEPTLLATAEVKKEIEARGPILPIAGYDAVLKATRKVDMLRFAESVGVPVPRSEVATERPPLEEVASRLGLPLVLKASTEIDLLPVERHYFLASRDPKLYAETFDRLARHGPVILQQYVPGYGAGMGLMYGPDGRLLAYSGHRRVFEQFSDGGPSVLASTLDHPVALQKARALLEALNWRGIGFVEYRITPAGDPVYMEVNPRVWGTMSLGMAAGVDFPRLMLEAFAGAPARDPVGPARRRSYLSFEALVTSATAPYSKRPHFAPFVFDLAHALPGLSIKEMNGNDPGPAVDEFFHFLRARESRKGFSEVRGVRFGPALDYGLLVPFGLRTVLDLREPGEVAARPLALPPGVERLAYPIDDDTGLTPDRFGQLTSLMERYAAKGGLYVHCRLGRGRAPMSVIGYLASSGLSAEEAFDAVYEARPATLLTAVQRAAICRYVRSLGTRRPPSPEEGPTRAAAPVARASV